MIGERVSHLSVSSCVPAPRCTRDSTPRSAHGVPPPASHGASPPAPHCAATPLVWCYLRLTARRISPRCSPRQHGLPRPYSPRRGDTHAEQVTPHKRSAVWRRSMVSQYGAVARSVVLVVQCGAAVWRRSSVLGRLPRLYSPRRGDTHAVQVAPYKRSAVW